MARWLGDEFWQVPLSSRFYYLVHRRSMLGVEAVEEHFARVHRLYREAMEDSNADYFQIDLAEAPQRLSEYECQRLCDPSAVAAAFLTPEIAVDPEAVARLVRARLGSDPNIRVLSRTVVRSASIEENGVWVEFTDSTGEHRERYAHAVNAAWESRLAIDLAAGIRPTLSWLYRVKHFLRFRHLTTPIIPSVTIVLGPFGDIVNYGNGDLFLSWYPSGMQGMSSEISPPEWLPASPDLAAKLRPEIVAALSEIVPAVGCLTQPEIEAAEVKGGTIFAWGATDIFDPTSRLHERYTIGPSSFGRYHSINTGKYTMAPLFANQVADRIRSIL
jgi:hypothetical protein